MGSRSQAGNRSEGQTLGKLPANKGRGKRSGQECCPIRMNSATCHGSPARREGWAGISINCSEHLGQLDRQGRLLLSIILPWAGRPGSRNPCCTRVLAARRLSGLDLEADSLPSLLGPLPTRRMSGAACSPACLTQPVGICSCLSIVFFFLDHLNPV